MNVAEALAREIGRVTDLRTQYVELPKKLAAAYGGGKSYQVNVNMAPAVFMMDQALERAKKAAGVDDGVEQMAALEVLRGFAE
jgi:hypothetical protein